MLDRDSLTVLPSDRAFLSLHMVPEEPGVYLYLLPAETGLPRNLLAQSSPWKIAGTWSEVLYVGATTWSLRERLKSHFGPRSESSSLRMSLGLLLEDQLDLQVHTIDKRRKFYFEPEQSLTDWILNNTHIAYFLTASPMEDERKLISCGYGLLNISGATPTAWTKYLAQRRRAHSSLQSWTSPIDARM